MLHQCCQRCVLSPRGGACPLAGRAAELIVDAIMGTTVLRLYFIPGDLSIKAMRRFLEVLLRGLGARGY
jgi:hypothetical protein